MRLMGRGPARRRARADAIEARTADQDAPVSGLSDYAVGQGWNATTDSLFGPGMQQIGRLVVIQRDPDALMGSTYGGDSLAGTTMWEVHYSNCLTGDRDGRNVTVANAYASVLGSNHPGDVGPLSTVYPGGVVLVASGHMLPTMMVEPRSWKALGRLNARADEIGHSEFDRRYHVRALLPPGSAPFPEDMITTALSREDWAFLTNGEYALVVRLEPFSSGQDLDAFLPWVDELVASLPEASQILPPAMSRLMPDVEQLRLAGINPFDGASSFG